MNIRIKNQSGAAHLAVLAVFVLATVVTAVFWQVNRQSADTASLQNATAATKRCSQNKRLVKGTCKKVYTYKRLTSAQERRIKKISSQYWHNVCGKNGRNIRIEYYSGDKLVRNLQDQYDHVDAFGSDRGVASGYVNKKIAIYTSTKPR